MAHTSDSGPETGDARAYGERRLSLPDGQYANLGFHEDGELAAAAYDCAAYVAKGHGATLNFRDDEGGPARNGDVPSPTSQPGGLIGRRVECRDDDGDWMPGVIIGYTETTVAYTVYRPRSPCISFLFTAPLARSLPSTLG